MKYPLTLKWSAAMTHFCQREKLYLAHPLRVDGIYQNGETVVIRGPVVMEKYSTVVRHNFFSSGAFSYANNFLPFDTKVGRYVVLPRGSRL